MKKLLIFIVVLLALLAAVGGGLLWALKDPNRFKPELQSLIQETTGMDVALDGDLSWQLWPPVVLKGTDIGFEDEETRYRIGSVGVKANLTRLITGGGTLEIDQLRVSDLLMTDKRLGDRTRINELRLDDFVPGEPSPLFVQAQLESDDEPTVDLTVEGSMSFFTDEDRLSIKPMAFIYDGIRGTCDVDASQLSRDPSINHEESKEDLLPLDVFRAMNWSATCNVPEYEVDGTVFRNVAIRSENNDARGNHRVEVPGALGGSVSADVAIDTRRRTPVWNIDTDADELQAQALMDLVAPSLKWVAPLLADGKITLKGNTAAALVDSANGAMTFGSQGGMIDIGAIKTAVLALSKLAGQDDKVSEWPEQLQYQDLGGRWQMNGTEQDLAFAIDNVKIAGKGLVNALSGELDMRTSITIERHPTLDALPINDDLYGLAIPMRCKGTLEAPDCGLDGDAAKRSLAALAGNKARGEVDDKLSEAIDEKVPEEYRETAKEALKSLGGLLGGRKKDDD
ncbi:MAG: AsmA family protein [Pseudomonadales bacterium]